MKKLRFKDLSIVLEFVALSQELILDFLNVLCIFWWDKSDHKCYLFFLDSQLQFTQYS